MMWMIPRMVRWTLNKPIAGYAENVIDPTIFNQEILMSIPDLRQESRYFRTFLYGTSEEKIAALDWLQSKHSWDAKRWLQGLLFDGDAQVRVRAAQYIADIHYIHYLPDMRAAYQTEKRRSSQGSDKRAFGSIGIAIAEIGTETGYINKNSSNNLLFSYFFIIFDNLKIRRLRACFHF
jgi:hypothetical protein